MAGGRFTVFGRPSTRFDAATLAGVGAALRIAHAGADEGERRMRELIEQMRIVEARPIAADNPSAEPIPAK